MALRHWKAVADLISAGVRPPGRDSSRMGSGELAKSPSSKRPASFCQHDGPEHRRDESGRHSRPRFNDRTMSRRISATRSPPAASVSAHALPLLEQKRKRSGTHGREAVRQLGVHRPRPGPLSPPPIIQIRCGVSIEPLATRNMFTGKLARRAVPTERTEGQRFVFFGVEEAEQRSGNSQLASRRTQRRAASIAVKRRRVLRVATKDALSKRSIR